MLITFNWRENNWIHTFPKGISTMWNANRIWTRVAVSISNNDNHYTICASFTNHVYLIYIYIYIYIYKQNFALNNLQGWHAIKHNQSTIMIFKEKKLAQELSFMNSIFYHPYEYYSMQMTSYKYLNTLSIVSGVIKILIREGPNYWFGNSFK